MPIINNTEGTNNAIDDPILTWDPNINNTNDFDNASTLPNIEITSMLEGENNHSTTTNDQMASSQYTT